MLGFELRALLLLGRCSTMWARLPAIFALITSETGPHFLPRPVWTAMLCYTSCCHWDDRLILPRPAFFSAEMGVLWCFCLVWPPTTILPISASQVARITAVESPHSASFCLSDGSNGSCRQY
jgi:hypothetical protein